MKLKKKIKTILVAKVITEARIGFKIPMEETVKLYSSNSKKKDLDKEWETEGKMAIAQSLSDRNIIEIKSIEWQTLDGTKINF